MLTGQREFVLGIMVEKRKVPASAGGSAVCLEEGKKNVV